MFKHNPFCAMIVYIDKGMNKKKIINRRNKNDM